MKFGTSQVSFSMTQLTFMSPFLYTHQGDVLMSQVKLFTAPFSATAQASKNGIKTSERTVLQFHKPPLVHYNNNNTPISSSVSFDGNVGETSHIPIENGRADLV